MARKTGSKSEPTDRMVAAGRKVIETLVRVDVQEDLDGVIRDIWQRMAMEAQKEREETTAAILAKLG